MTSPLDLLHASWRMYRDHARLFVGYASWLLLTYAAIVLMSLIPESGPQLGTALLVEVADLVLWMWMAVIMTLLAVSLASGKEPDTAKLPTDAWKLLWPFVLVGILQGLVTLGGFLLLVVPGLIFLVWYSFAQQALLIDGKRGLEAMTASRDLCRGRFFTVAWYLFLGLFVTSAAMILFIAVVFLSLSAITGTNIETVFGADAPLWADVTVTVTDIFVMPLLYIYWVLTYLELKKLQQKS